jgi:hypothetical protein
MRGFVLFELIWWELGSAEGGVDLLEPGNRQFQLHPVLDVLCQRISFEVDRFQLWVELELIHGVPVGDVVVVCLLGEDQKPTNLQNSVNLTQNSSNASKCLMFSITLNRFFAMSNVSIFVLLSKFSSFSIPFSEMYSSVKFTSAPRFSIFVIRLFCSERQTRFVSLSRFWILVILFLPM